MQKVNLSFLLLVILAVSLASSALAASIPGTVVSAKITTGNTANTFPIGDTDEMAGTPKQVANTTAMMAIPADRRKVGMTCYVIDENQEYRLVGGIANEDWVLMSDYVPPPPPDPVTNYIVAGYWTNDVIVNQFITENIFTNYYSSNYFSTNYYAYSYPTNLWWTNIVDADSTVSNLWYQQSTEWTAYLTNYFTTNQIVAMTNAIYDWASGEFVFRAGDTMTGLLTLPGLIDTSGPSNSLSVAVSGPDGRVTWTNMPQMLTLTVESNLVVQQDFTVYSNAYFLNNMYVSNAFVTNLTVLNTVVVESNVVVKGTLTVNHFWLTNAAFRFISTWAGPTNSLNVTNNLQVYQTYTPCAITSFVGGVTGFAADSQLSISNASDSNITVYITAAASRSGDYTNAYVITNSDVLDIGAQNINGSWTKYLQRSFH